MYHEIDSNAKSIIFGAEELTPLPVVNIVPVNVTETGKFASLAELPHHRVDLVNRETAERAGLWVKFSDWTFDPNKHDSATMIHLIDIWLVDLLALLARRGEHYSVVDYRGQSFILTDDNKSRSETRSGAEYLWAALCGYNNTRLNASSHLSTASVSLHETTEGSHYQFMLKLGNGVSFHATKRDQLNKLLINFARPMDWYYEESPKIKPMGIFEFKGQNYEFIFTHAMLGEQLMSKIKPSQLTEAYWVAMKKNLPFLLDIRTNDDLILQHNDLPF